MTKEEILNHECIWGAMYGMDDPKLNCIVDIETSKLDFTKEYYREGFYYVWGWPGPDFNFYPFDMYGKSWFFTLEEARAAGFQTYEERAAKEKIIEESMK